MPSSFECLHCQRRRGRGEGGNAEAVQDVAGALFLGEREKMVKGNFAHYF